MAAGRQLVFVIIAIVVAMGLFVRSEEQRFVPSETPNLFIVLVDEVRKRFGLFYDSFERVMGAQITISSINTDDIAPLADAIAEAVHAVGRASV